MAIGVVLAFVVYFVALLLIGVLSYRRSKNATDFIVGGRSLNFYVTALSAHASDMSSWLFMAYPAMIFLGGGTNVWVAIGLIIGMWCNWQFVAPRLREETERTGALTLSSYFGIHFRDRKHVLQALGALLSLLFFACYVAAGLVGIGIVFESVFGFDRNLGMAIGITVVAVYTLVGGYHSIAWVDLWQAIFMLIMIIIVPIVAATKLGGGDVVQQAVAAKGLSFNIFGDSFAGLAGILFASFGWGLGYFGQIHILSKFMGIQHRSEMRKSQYLGISWQILCLGAATAIGFIAIGYFPLGAADPELVFVNMVKQIFHPFFGGLVLCGVLAATISTMDSQMLVLVSVLSEDIYRKFVRTKAHSGEMVWVARIIVVVIALAAYIIASQSVLTIRGLVFYSWSGLGSTFGPVLLFALHSKRVNLYGAITGMAFGGVISSVWPLVNAFLPIEVPALIPGFVLNSGVIYLVSLATRKCHYGTPAYRHSHEVLPS